MNKFTPVPVRGLDEIQKHMEATEELLKGLDKEEVFEITLYATTQGWLVA